MLRFKGCLSAVAALLTLQLLLLIVRGDDVDPTPCVSPTTAPAMQGMVRTSTSTIYLTGQTAIPLGVLATFWTSSGQSAISILNTVSVRILPFGTLTAANSNWIDIECIGVYTTRFCNGTVDLLAERPEWFGLSSYGPNDKLLVQARIGLGGTGDAVSVTIVKPGQMAVFDTMTAQLPFRVLHEGAHAIPVLTNTIGNSTGWHILANAGGYPFVNITGLTRDAARWPTLAGSTAIATEEGVVLSRMSITLLAANGVSNLGVDELAVIHINVTTPPAPMTASFQIEALERTISSGGTDTADAQVYEIPGVTSAVGTLYVAPPDMLVHIAGTVDNARLTRTGSATECTSAIELQGLRLDGTASELTEDEKDAVTCTVAGTTPTVVVVDPDCSAMAVNPFGPLNGSDPSTYLEISSDDIASVDLVVFHVTSDPAVAMPVTSSSSSTSSTSSTTSTSSTSSTSSTTSTSSTSSTSSTTSTTSTSSTSPMSLAVATEAPVTTTAEEGATGTPPENGASVHTLSPVLIALALLLASALL